MQLAERFKQGGREVKKASTLRPTGFPCRPAEGARIFILGLTFKENCLDLRNTRVTDLIAELHDYGLQVDVHDPWAEPEDARQEYGFELMHKNLVWQLRCHRARRGAPAIPRDGSRGDSGVAEGGRGGV